VTPERRVWVRRQARAWLPLAAVLACHGIVRLVVVHTTASAGPFTPGRPVDRGLAGLVIAALVLRVTVLIAVPAVIAYRIATALIGRVRRRSDQTPRAEQPPR